MLENKKTIILFAFLSGVSLSGILFLSFKSNPDGSYNYENFQLPQKVLSIPLDYTFEFSGETMPINRDTRERMDRELSVNAYWQSATLMNIKLSAKYFPIIEKIFAEEGIPDDFKYLAVAESSLRNATSPSQAKGYWQFMKPTAVEMGLEISEDVDQRFDIFLSTKAAAQYLKAMYKRFGSWTNVAAAYNMGPTAFSNALKEQKENSYYDLNINDESSRYVFRIIAIKEIIKNPKKYGYHLMDEDFYTSLDNTKSVTVNASIGQLADFAKLNGISYRMLKYYNPWLISGKLHVAPGKTYDIILPQ